MNTTPAPGPRRPLLLGALAGALVPLLGLVGLVAGQSYAAARLSSLSWTLTVLVGAGLLVPARTHRWGVGVLLGFGAAMVLAAGSCTVLVFSPGGP